MRVLFQTALAVCILSASLAAAPMTKLNIVVKAQGGKPVDRASVVVRFVEGHSIVKLGKLYAPPSSCARTRRAKLRSPRSPRQNPHSDHR